MREALAEAIRYHVRYNSRDENGETRAERNARFGMSHKTPEDPEIPVAVEHVWGWFWLLSSQRRPGLTGPDPLGWLDIRAWTEMTHTPVLAEEVDLLVAMDHAYREEVRKEPATSSAAGGEHF